MKRVIDYRQVEMTDEESTYLEKLLSEFPDGKDQLRGLFEVDGDGCIVMVTPPVRKQISWGVLFFFQNLMINQRLRRLERLQAKALQNMEERHSEAIRRLYDLAKEERE